MLITCAIIVTPISLVNIKPYWMGWGGPNHLTNISHTNLFATICFVLYCLDVGHEENNLLNTNLVYQNINMMNNNIPDQIYIIIMLLHVTIVLIT